MAFSATVWAREIAIVPGGSTRVSTEAPNRSCNNSTHSCTTPSGGAGAGSDQHRLVAGEPAQVDVGRPVDQMGRHAARPGQLRQPPAVGTVLAADDQHHVGLAGQQPDRLLPVLRGIADVVARRADDLRKPPPQVAR